MLQASFPLSPLCGIVYVFHVVNHLIKSTNSIRDKMLSDVHAMKCEVQKGLVTQDIQVSICLPMFVRYLTLVQSHGGSLSMGG